MNRNSQRIFILLGFLLALATLIAVGVSSYFSIQNLIAAARSVDDSIKTISTLDDVLSNVLNAETGQRGYLITGESTYLQPYQDALAQINQDARELEGLVADDPAQVKSLPALKSAIATKLQELQDTIDLRRSQGFDAARQAVLTNQGLASMDEIRRVIGEMEAHEHGRLQQRIAERAEIDQRARIVVGGGALIALLITAGSAVLLRHYMRLRQEAQNQLLESEVKFRAVAENAAASLFIVQGDHFRYTNPATTAITGYSEQELSEMDFYTLIHPDYREMMSRYNSARQRGENAPATYEMKVIARDGTVHWGEVSMGVIQYEGKPAVVGLAYDITERKRGEQQIQQQMSRLNALRAIDRAITGSLDLRLTLDLLVGQMREQLKVDAAAVLLLDPHTQTLEYVAGQGFRTAAIQHTHLQVGKGYAGRAVLEQRIVHVSDLADAQNDFGRAPLLAQENFVAYYAVPLIAKGQVKGVLEIFHRAPLEADAEWLNFLETLAGQAAIAIDSAQLFDRIQRSNVELKLAYERTIEGWSRALDLRDKETEGHSQRVTEMTMRLARALGITNSELVHIRHGALLHDIGKMGVPDAILLKPGQLNAEEWETMQKHPTLAYEMLLPIEYLRPALDIPYCHHEKWDGTGYPRGLKGEAIPLSARIFAIVDVYDALTNDRPYRKAWTREKTLDYIKEQAEKHFDRRVVNIFISSNLGKDMN